MANNKKKVLYLLGTLFLLLVCTIIFTTYHNKRRPNWEYAPQMYRSVPYEHDSPNPVFADGKTAREPVKHTVAKGFEPFPYPNTQEGLEAAGKNLKNPLPTTKFTIEEGKQLFLQRCQHCHGKTGRADGKVVTNGGFPPPPAYNSPQLKDLEEGRIFFVITYGLRTMPAFGSVISREDRWKIVKYIQVLQKEQ
ncbi:MAG: c-type cytochrome [Solitalea-like symbiont of Tyrophagus putrescentiae]